MSSDKHMIRQEFITFGPKAIMPPGWEEEIKQKKKQGDPLSYVKNVNGWGVRMDITNGKITMIGEKTLGRTGTIKVILETAENTGPSIKLIPIPYDLYSHEGKYCEVNDRKGRENREFTTESKDEYERVYMGSSIVTPSEFFNQAVPSYFDLLKQKTLDDFVPKIADEISKIQAPAAIAATTETETT